MMKCGKKIITKRKVAFIFALLTNTLVTLGQQLFMLRLFYQEHNAKPQAIEFVKITL